MASILLVAAVLAATPQSAQAEKTNLLPSLGLSMEKLAQARQELIFDEPGDGRTWARSPGWKASFGPEGLTYVPFFGSTAPKSFPLRLNLGSVSVSGEPLGLESRERRRSGSTVTFDRGTVREVYHLDELNVEQTFVFDTLPATGEIVLDIDLETELAGRQHADGSLEFGNEYGLVRYGSATAIDAAGKSLALEQTLDNGHLRIRVPASFVASATFPLTVDPIISTFSFGTGPRSVTNLDAAYDAKNTTYQIVFSERQSATDSDILTINYNAPLGLLVSLSSIDITSSNWIEPANASAHHEEQFLCVGLRGSGVGNREVWGRTRNADTGARGPQFRISGFGADAVDVGGKGNDVISVYDYMVVWQEADIINQDFDIVAQAVNGDSTLTNSRIMIDGDAGDYDTNPSISKSSGRPDTPNGTNEYMIVWQREVGADNRNVRAQVIEYTGDMGGHSQFNAYTFSDSINADVSTVGSNIHYVSERHWLIAFERRTGTDYDIFTVVATDGDADNARSLQTMQNLEQDLDHRDPTICFNGVDHLILYQTEAPSGDRSVHMTAVNVVLDGSELRTGLTLRRETLALSKDAPASFGLASHWDGGSPDGSGEPGSGLAIWTTRDAATGDYDPAGAVVTEGSRYNLGSQYCAAALNSTGTSGQIYARGISFDSAFNFRLEAAEIAPNSFGHFLVSNQSGFVVNPGGSAGNLCLQGAVGRFNRSGEIMNSGADGFFDLDVNPANLPSPNGTVSIQAGETWYFQCWFRDLGPTSNFTNAIQVGFD